MDAYKPKLKERGIFELLEISPPLSTSGSKRSDRIKMMEEAYIKPEYPLSEITSRIIAAATLFIVI
jgi:hypothetical protein